APTAEQDGKPLVILAARMIWPKGILAFVEAARELRKQGVAARFALVGEPDPGNPESISLHQLKEWDREGAVECWGARTDMPAVYQGAHVVCLPSYYGEGVPRALIEAAASARAIVATDIPGCREIVQDTVNGFLVSPNDSQGLTEALGMLLNDPLLRKRMGSASRAIFEAGFEEEQVIGDTVAVYDRLLTKTFDELS
ncbi:MAG: glycosyltransferase, partial [Pseudomonadota bacterium]